MKHCLAVILVVTLSTVGSASAYQIVRSDDPNARIIDVQRAGKRVADPWMAIKWLVNAGAAYGATDAPTFTMLAPSGQSLPIGEAGFLNAGATFNSAAVDRDGRIALVAQVWGAKRNQGIFMADSSGLRVIALGCGAIGGSGSTADCGDPTPIGGTFSGMFLGTTPTLAMNDNGDVVFVADVAGGSSPRALFLYRSSSDDIIKIAAVGDVSPRGGILSAVGSGSINNHGRVVFLASTGGNGSQGSDVLLWHNGIVSAYVAVGDPAPGGGTFDYIGSEAIGFKDGTFVPTGPAPAINDSNQIAFSGTSQSTRGLLVSEAGLHKWQVRAGESAPGGGVYVDFAAAPVLNGRGDIAFLAEVGVSVAGPVTGGGWFTGARGEFRRALAFRDPLLEGNVSGLAYSRNPYRPLDDSGNLVLWARHMLADMSEREIMLVSRYDGTIEIIAREGEPSPVLTDWGNMKAWPNANSANQVLFGAVAIDGGSYIDAHFLATRVIDFVFRDGFEKSQNP